jgi:hypothetical protein
MSNHTAPPRPRQILYSPPGPEFQDEVDKVLDRQQLDGLSPLAKFKFRLTQFGIPYTPEGDGFRTRCPLACGDSPSLVFCAGKDDKLVLVCHRCVAPYAKIMEALELTTHDGFTGAQSHDDELVEYPLLLALQRARQRRSEDAEGDLPPQIDQAVIDHFTAANSQCMQAIRDKPGKLRQLAAQLEVAEDALMRLSVGWIDSNRVQDECGQWIDAGGAWTFPERAGQSIALGNDPGPIIGIMRRFEDPRFGKRVIAGSLRGLYVPYDWQSLADPILIPEGASDVAAIISTGRRAIGRPSATGGVEHLAEILRCRGNTVVVLGENDRKPNGSWPGREGMTHVADALAERLHRPIKQQLPPTGLKDARDFLRSAIKNKEVSQ